MTNTTRRRCALVLLVIGALTVAMLSTTSSSTEVATVDDPAPTSTADVPTTVAATTVPKIPVVTTTTESAVTVVQPVESTTAAPAPVDSAVLPPAAVLATPAPAQELQPAVRAATGVCTTDEAYCNPPTTPADPLAEFQGTFACRFATAGRVTPCCPDATKTLALFWTGYDLAVADYIVGREGGCREVINSSGCVGWFQLCGWKCNGPCTNDYNNAEKARWLFDQFGWCSTGSWYLAGDRVTGHGGAACH